jgi:magnesium transporter
MRELIVRTADGVCHNEATFDSIDQFLKDPATTLWLDIYDPDESDIALLRDEFQFHPLAIEDATRDIQRPKVDIHQNFYLIVFYTARFTPNAEHIEIQELDLFVGRNFIVSVHDGKMTQVRETIKRWRSTENPLENKVGALLYALLDTVVDDYFPLIDELADRVDQLEDQIFLNFNNNAIETIFGLKKDLLMLRRVLAPQRDILNTLMRRDIPVFGPGDQIYLQDVYDHIIRVTDSIDTYRDLLSSALDSFLSLQSNKLNQIVKVLTITSIMLMSSSLVAGIYGMNFDLMPELRWTYGYPFALGLMLVISTGLYFFFKRMKWF